MLDSPRSRHRQRLSGTLQSFVCACSWSHHAGGPGHRSSPNGHPAAQSQGCTRCRGQAVEAQLASSGSSSPPACLSQGDSVSDQDCVIKEKVTVYKSSKLAKDQH